MPLLSFFFHSTIYNLFQLRCLSSDLCASGKGEPQEILQDVLKRAWGKDTGNVSWEMAVAG